MNFFSAAELLKHSIAPDAAALISQGDSLVLETHGKDRKLSQIVMKTQSILREKFREVQQSKGISKSMSSLDSYTKDERNDSLGRKDINFEELVSKGLKRVYDLIEKPIDRLSEDELQMRISEIKVRFYFFFGFILKFDCSIECKILVFKSLKPFEALIVFLGFFLEEMISGTKRIFIKSF